MGIIYPIELRTRVINYLEEGGDKEEASEVFQVSVRTITNWQSRKKLKGNLMPEKTGSKGKRKFSYEALREYVKKKNDSTLKEMGEIFMVSYRSIDYALKILGVTRKKKHAIRGARRKKAPRIHFGNQ